MPWGRDLTRVEDLGYSFHAVSALANMVNVPKTRRTFRKKCGKHRPHKVTQYKKARILCMLRGSGVMTGSRVGMVGRLSQFSGKRLKLQRILC